MKLIQGSSLNTMRLSCIDNRPFIFDIFLIDNKLHIIGPGIPGFDINNLSIYNDDNKLILKTNYSTLKGGEPIMFLIYDCINKDSFINIEVKYNDEIMSFNISNQYTVQEFEHKLSITTLCFNDYELFPMWHEYYRKQGIDHFYIYYNGIVGDKKKFFDYDDVTLIEWPFKYWNSYRRKKLSSVHHAQPAYLNHSLYLFGKKTSEYIIYCDLDEYLQTHCGIKIPNDMITIKQLITERPNIDVIRFLNLWAETIDNKIPTSFPDNFLVSQHIQKVERTKNLYKTSVVKCISIHSPHPIWHKKTKFNTIPGMFFHFYNWSRKFRKIHEKKPFILIKPDV